MALHLNLHHEIQKQELQRRRDPLKLGMMGMMVIAVGFLGYYFYRLENVRSVNSELSRLQAQWSATEPKLKAAQTREAEIEATLKTKAVLVQLIENRFYWAPLLEKVLVSVPREVQVTKLDGEMGDKLKAGSLLVSGISSGDQPRKVAEDLRTTFVNKLSEKYKGVNSSFKGLEDSEQTVHIDGKTVATATFSMQFQLAMDATAPVIATARKQRVAKQ